MSKDQKYSHLLSPMKIGNVVLKNRMISSPSRPLFTQGGEKYPTDNWIAHFEKKARNGAAIVTCSGSGGEAIEPVHGLVFDIFDGHNQHYLSQLTEACHFYGTKVHMAIYPIHDKKWDVSTGVPSIFVMGDGSQITYGEEVPEEEILRITEYMSEQAKVLKEECGFDGCFLHMCYKATLLARSLSPLTNIRTDKYGGSLENRARWPLMVCDAIKKKCGKDFLIEVCISGDDPKEGGWTLQDSIDFAKMGIGHFDMLQLRSAEIDPNHPISFEPNPTPWLYMAEAVKKSGVNMPVVAISGFSHPDYGEAALASGKADFIASARSWISNPEYGGLILEGRGEDIVPCLRCNKCHKSSMADPWASVCSVNPVWGLEAKIERMIPPKGDKKTVAVIGGGPAGMKAALVAKGRGHDVTIYEKSDKLGGLLKCADEVAFKWTLKNFKEYLIRQVKKSGITVKLGTEATPAMLEKENYDVVLAAIGSQPITPPIPGLTENNVFSAVDIYSGKFKVNTDDAVIIGGGEIGVETGILLARQGKKVTVLEMRERLAMDSTPVHYYSMFMAAWQKEKNLVPITNARCTEIKKNGVAYIDADGKAQFVEAGTVIIAAGMKPKTDEALTFADCGKLFRLIGDCNKVGNVQKCMRSAFGIAVSI